MTRALSEDNVAIVDPNSPVLNSLLGKAHLGRLSQLPQLIQDAVYAADNGLSFNNIISGLVLRPGVRTANINSQGVFRGWDPNPVIALSNTPISATLLRPDEVPQYIRDMFIGNFIAINDLRKIDIQAYSFKEFPLESTQVYADQEGNQHIIILNNDEESKISFFRHRIFERETCILTQQFIDGPLYVPDISRIKDKYAGLPLNPLLSTSKQNMVKDLKAKMLAIDAFILLTMKCSGSLDMIKTKLLKPSNAVGNKYDTYCRIIKSLNLIHLYHPDMAEFLALHLLHPNALFLDPDQRTYFTLFRNIPNSIQHFNLKLGNLQGNELFMFTPSSNSKNDRDVANDHSSQALNMINDGLNLAVEGIYLPKSFTASSRINGGNNYIENFLHIMDAYIHHNLPGQWDRNAIFMEYTRIDHLLNDDKSIILESEMNCVEDLLKKCIALHRKFTQNENLDAFIRLIQSKTTNPYALWNNGVRMGFLYTQTATNLPSASFISKLNPVDVEWKFIRDMHSQSYIGFLQDDALMFFPQLDIVPIFVGGSTAELESILSTSVFKRPISGTDNFEKVKLSPGQITNINGVNIAPRNLMPSSQVLIRLPSGRVMVIDYIKYFNDIRINGNPFADAGRALPIGYHGMKTLQYALNKLSKIKEVQEMEGSFISVIKNNQVWSNFKDILNSPLHPYYISNNQRLLGTVLIDQKAFDYLEEISNSPDTYEMSYENVIDDITRIAHGITLSTDNPVGILAKNQELNEQIAEAFGKSVDVNGNIILRSVDEHGKVLLDQQGEALMHQWWTNFRNSHQPINQWHAAHIDLLFQNVGLIRAFYDQIDSAFQPLWVQNSW